MLTTLKRRSGAALATGQSSPDGVETGSRKRIRHTLSGWRQLAPVAYRDPEHVAERIALHSVLSLGNDSLAWAQRIAQEREGVPRAVIAEQLRIESARVAAIDGAVAGTPFLIALVPGYAMYLRQEARMPLRIAAPYERDPRELETAAEMLALRGVHPTVDAARSDILAVRDRPLPEKPASRRPRRTSVRSASEPLILGGFSAPPPISARRVLMGAANRPRPDASPATDSSFPLCDGVEGQPDALGGGLDRPLIHPQGCGGCRATLAFGWVLSVRSVGSRSMAG